MNKMITISAFLFFALFCTSSMFAFTVNSVDLNILEHPVYVPECSGSTATLSVVAEGNDLTYRWQVNEGNGFYDLVYDESNYFLFTGPTFETPILTKDMNLWSYRCVVSSGFGSAREQLNSDPATIRFKDLMIYQQPVDENVTTGSYHSFLIYATGGNINYQWQINTGTGFVNLADNNEYRGTKEKLLSIPVVSTAMNQHQYRCLLSGGECGSTSESVLSDPLTLTVTPAVLQPIADPNQIALFSNNRRIVITGNPILYIDGALEVQGTTGGVLPPSMIHSYSHADIYLTGNLINNAATGTPLFTNSGDFTKMILTGANAQTISGTSELNNFYHLQINKDNSTDALTMEQDISIRSILEFGVGDLDLNGHDAQLTYANPVLGYESIHEFPSLFNESEENRMLDNNASLDGGKLFFSQSLNTTFGSIPSLFNPGKLGVGLETDNNSFSGDSITISRGHFPQAIGTGSGINRYYEIERKNSHLNSDINFTFQYLEGPNTDIGTADKANLQMFRQSNSAPAGLEIQAPSSFDVNANTQTINAVDTLDGLWTLLECIDPPVVNFLEGENLFLCAGQDSSIAIDIVSGTPIAYTWVFNDIKNPSETTGTFLLNSLALKGDGAIDTLVVFAFDDKGCLGIDSIFIEQQPSPFANISTPVAFPILNDTISACENEVMEIQLLSTNVTYDWSINAVPISTNQSINYTAISGTSEIIIEVATPFGCIDSDTLYVTGNNLPIIEIPADTFLCAITPVPLSMDQGAGDFSYIWFNETTNSTIGGTPQIDVIPANTGLTKIIATVINNTSNCQTTDSTLISVSDISLSIAKTDITCFGASDGTASLTVTGNLSNFSYQWSNGAPTPNIADLHPATYTVVFSSFSTNGNCFFFDDVTIEEPDPITATANKTDVNCYGGNTGTIDLIVSPGNYSYSWNTTNGSGLISNNQDQVGLSAGDYSLTITDENACEIYLTVPITQPNLLELTINKTDLSCNGATDGTANIQVTGGSSSYTYAWTTANGTGLIADNQNQTNLSVGDYQVVVTDDLGCTASSMIQIEEPNVLTSTTNQTNIDCHGANNGSLILQIAGGTLPYTFLWSTTDGAGLIANEQNQTNLHPGNYQLIVTDLNGCTMMENYLIEEAPLLFIPTNNILITNTACANDENGSIAFTNIGIGGTAPYNFAWQGPDAFTSTNPDINMLSAGTYNLTVTDAKGCEFSTTYQIESPEYIITNTNSTPVNCGAVDDGTITIDVSGEYPPYAYAWSPNFQDNATGLAGGQLITGLAGDFNGIEYIVTVTDNIGCSEEGFFYIQDSNLGITDGNETITNVSCVGGSDGAIELPFNPNAYYVWFGPNGFITDNYLITNLAAGTYSVMVSFGEGCDFTADYLVEESTSPLTVSIQADDPISCFGSADGSFQAVPAGGTPPYSYSWSNGSNAQFITGQASDNYTVSLTDSYGCEVTSDFFLDQPTPIDTTNQVSFSNVNCGATADGSIELAGFITGGNPPYAFAWSNGATTGNISNLPGGYPNPIEYTVTITDTENCQNDFSFNIYDYNAIEVLDENITNISCAGETDGVISLSISNEFSLFYWSGPNGYASNPEVDFETINNLSPGNYTVTITDLTDENVCPITATYTIEDATPLTVNPSILTEISCNDSSDGRLVANPFGGSLPYSFAWSDGSTEQINSNLSEGDYLVTITDLNGCSVISNAITLTAPSAILLEETVNIVDVSCGASANGSIEIEGAVFGGNAPYSFAWSTGATTANITGLTGGHLNPATYTVTITDADNCQNDFSFEIYDRNLLAIDEAIIIKENCFGDENGSITLAVSGNNLAFNWSGPNGYVSDPEVDFETINNLLPGEYTVLISNSINNQTCPITATYTLEATEELTVTTSQTEITCINEIDGTATVLPTGGTTIGTYTYLWSNGATTATITGLIPGNYQVTVTDDNACTAAASVLIAQPIFSVSFETINSTCGDMNGQITATVTGGETPHTFLWNNGATTPTIDALTSGTYDLTITNNIGCVITEETIVDNIDAPEITTISTTKNLCNGTALGSIDIAITGGISPYAINWSNGATTEDISNLLGDIYSVEITDNNGCTTTEIFDLLDPLLLEASVLKTNISCNELNNGGLEIITLGGTLPYTYSWNTGATADNLTGLSVGDYAVTITDANGCTLTQSANIEAPDLLEVTITAPTEITCNNPTGTATAIATGGTGNYSFLWSNGSTLAQAINLPAGTNEVTVTDENNCTVIATTEVMQIQELQVQLLTQTEVDCHGNATGSATIAVSGGTLPYQYAWSEGTSTSASADDLPQGIHAVTVTDTNGCNATLSINISEPSLLELNVSVTHQTTVNLNNGTATAFVTGGRTPYIYAWNTGENSEMITDLAPGNYAITITDGNACSVEELLVVDPISCQIEVSGIVSDVSCAGDSDGSISLTVTNGSLPITYDWDHDELDGLSAPNDLSMDIYSVTVTGADGCSTTFTEMIEEPNALTASLVMTQTSSNLINDGALDLTVAGGTTPYTYLWSTGQTLQNINNLFIGEYTVLITDDRGCTLELTETVTTALALSVSLETTEINCNGNQDGSIASLVIGGTLPYTYQWNTGATSAMIDNLIAGIYRLTVTDGAGSSMIETVELIDPTIINSLGTEIPISCFGESDGGINLLVLGGTGDYDFSWSTGAATQNISGLIAGEYQVTITDENSCFHLDTIVLDQPDVLLIAVDMNTSAACAGTNTGALSVSITGGSLPYQYNWNSGQVTEDLQNIPAGTYQLTVTDANDCIAILEEMVIEPEALSLALNGESQNCNGLGDGFANTLVTGGTGTYTYQWSNGETTASIQNLVGDTYTVTVTDAAGCTMTESIELSVPDLLATQIISLDVSCYDGNNGGVFADVSGGTTPYNYSWSNAATTQEVGDLTVGTYYLTVTDGNNCILLDSVEISAPAEIGILANIDSLNCFQDFSGSIDLAIAGGSTPYSYNWNTGQVNNQINNLEAGIYTVTITDGNNCERIESFDVFQPTAFVVMDSVLDVSCFGENNGVIDLAIAGGTTPYTTLWDSGATAARIEGLSPGNYAVDILDAAGCLIEKNIAIEEPELLLLQKNIQRAGCKTDDDGYIQLSPSGGVTPYRFAWDNGNTDQDNYGLSAGDYTITMTDVNGCTYLETITVEATPGRFDVQFLVASGLLTATDTVTVASNLDLQFVDVSNPAPTFWYWDFGVRDGTTSTETNPVFSYPFDPDNANTNYQAQLIASNLFCTDSITKNIIITNRFRPAIEEPTDTAYVAFKNVAAYPNPSGGEVTVDIDLTKAAVVEISVISATGQTHFQETLEERKEHKVNLDLSGLNRGVYFVYLKTLNRSYVLRVVLMG